MEETGKEKTTQSQPTGEEQNGRPMTGALNAGIDPEGLIPQILDLLRQRPQDWQVQVKKLLAKVPLGPLHRALRLEALGVFPSEHWKVKRCITWTLCEMNRKMFEDRARFRNVLPDLLRLRTEETLWRQRARWSGNPEQFARYLNDQTEAVAAILPETAQWTMLDWVDKNKPLLTAIARGKGVPGPDLIQEVRASVLENPDSFNESKGDLDKYMKKVANNTAVGMRRRPDVAPIPRFEAQCNACGRFVQRRTGPSETNPLCKDCKEQVVWEKTQLGALRVHDLDVQGPDPPDVVADGHFKGRAVAKAVAALHKLDRELILRRFNLHPKTTEEQGLLELADQFAKRRGLRGALKQYFPNLEDYTLAPGNSPANTRINTVRKWIHAVLDRLKELSERFLREEEAAPAKAQPPDREASP